MAGTVTHHKFSDDVEKKLNKDIPINSQIFHLSSQGHDLGMFFKWYDLKKRGETHKFALEVLQDTNFLEYISNYIKYIKENNLENNTDVKNYLYGYIAHHYLDSFVHPYIIYKTGEPNKNNSDTYKYRGNHCMYETQIDKTFLEKFYDTKNVHTIFPKHIDIDKNLVCTNEYAFLKTYNKEEYGKYYVEAMNYVYSFLMVFRNDSTKIKLLSYKTLDYFLKQMNSLSTYEFLSFNLKSIEYNDLLKEEIWKDPTNNESHLNSFMDLYKEAEKIVINAIEQIENIIMDRTKNDQDIYKSHIPNRSAIHGHECNKNLELKYFKY